MASSSLSPTQIMLKYSPHIYISNFTLIPQLRVTPKHACDLFQISRHFPALFHPFPPISPSRPPLSPSHPPLPPSRHLVLGLPPSFLHLGPSPSQLRPISTAFRHLRRHYPTPKRGSPTSPPYYVTRSIGGRLAADILTTGVLWVLKCYCRESDRNCKTEPRIRHSFIATIYF